MKTKLLIINTLIIFFLLLGFVYADFYPSVSKNDPEIIYIDITGPDLVIRGNSADYTCTAYFDDNTNQDVTNLTEWKSLCEYADFDSNGQLFTTQSPQTVDPSTYPCLITASYENRIRSFEVTLKDMPVLSVLQDVLDVSEQDGNTYFNIENTGGAEMTWTVQEESDWFSVNPSAGTNKGTVFVRYKDNCGEARTGEITIFAPDASGSPQTVEIRQAHGYQLYVAPELFEVPETAGAVSFEVSNVCTGEMEWTVSENSDWFSITPGYGTNTETVTVTYDSNSGDPRTGFVTVTAPGATDSPWTVKIRQDSVAWVKMDTNVTDDLRGIWGSSLTNIFAVGKQVILRYDGNVWTKMPDAAFYHLNGVWGSAEEDVFAVGMGGAILHYDGNAWTNMFSGTYRELRGVWGSSGTNVYAVGEKGTLVYYNGNEEKRWEKVLVPTLNTLNKVWGSSENDVYAVGGDWDTLTVLHYDGNAWSEIPNDSFNSAYGIRGVENDLFVVGNSSMIVCYSNNRWTEMTNSTSEYFRGVWGNSLKHVFAAGTGGTVVQYIFETQAWSEMATSSSKDLYGIWGISENDVFAVGDSGTILRFSQGQALGDADGNRVVDLGDALFVLKILAGMNPGAPGPDADINKDGKIGIQEVVYILQKIAGSEDV